MRDEDGCLSSSYQNLKYYLFKKNNPSAFRAFLKEFNYSCDTVFKQVLSVEDFFLTQEVNALLNLCQKNNIGTISIDQMNYSKTGGVFLDKSIFFYKGNIDLLSKKLIGFTGSRIPTDSGVKFAQELAEFISAKNIPSVGGLAIGIDKEIHQYTLKSGTVAVLGSGILEMYPKENTKLYYDIIDHQGLILSEFQPLERPNAKYFLQRNKTITQLAAFLIMVQARENSGSMMTAKFADKTKKTVFYLDSSDIGFEGNIALRNVNIGIPIAENNYKQILEKEIAKSF